MVKILFVCHGKTHIFRGSFFTVCTIRGGSFTARLFLFHIHRLQIKNKSERTFKKKYVRICLVWCRQREREENVHAEHF